MGADRKRALVRVWETPRTQGTRPPPWGSPIRPDLQNAYLASALGHIWSQQTNEERTSRCLSTK